jgi:AbrB family looped-hinge helix DNA binding protein
MKSTITAKFQTTIPRDVRERLKLAVHDTIDWRIEDDRIVVVPLRRDFLRHRNRITVGAGSISVDLAAARQARAERHR